MRASKQRPLFMNKSFLMFCISFGFFCLQKKKKSPIFYLLSLSRSSEKHCVNYKPDTFPFFELNHYWCFFLHLPSPFHFLLPRAFTVALVKRDERGLYNNSFIKKEILEI